MAEEKSISQMGTLELTDMASHYVKSIESISDGEYKFKITTDDNNVIKLRDENQLRALCVGIRLGRRAALAAVYRLPS